MKGSVDSMRRLFINETLCLEYKTQNRAEFRIFIETGGYFNDHSKLLLYTLTFTLLFFLARGLLHDATPSAQKTRRSLVLFTESIVAVATNPFRCRYV